ARILHRELSAAYAAARAGGDPALPPLAIDYADYAVWQTRQSAGSRPDPGLAFWKRRLADLPPLALPPDFARPPAQSFRGAVVGAGLPLELARAFKALARAHGATSFVALLSAFAVLIGRLAGSTDFAIGTPVAARVLPVLQPIVGFF